MKTKSSTLIATFFAAIILMLSAATLTVSAQTDYDKGQDVRLSALEAKRKGKAVRSKNPGRLSALEQKAKTQGTDIGNLKQADLDQKAQRDKDIAEQKSRDDGQDRDINDLDDRVNAKDKRMDGLAALIYDTGFWVVVMAIVFGVPLFILIISMIIGYFRNNDRFQTAEARLGNLEADVRRHNTEIVDVRITANSARHSSTDAHRRINTLGHTVLQNARTLSNAVGNLGRRNAREIGALSGRVELLETPPYITSIIDTSTGRPETPAAGGAMMRASGGNFYGPATVTVNGVAATNVTVMNPNTVEFTAPAGAAGHVHVVVTCGRRTAFGTITYV